MAILDILIETIQTLFLCIFALLEQLYCLITPNSWRYKNVAGQNVLITGAGSGLGRGMSIQFAKLGCNLVLWDVDTTGNAETEKLVKEVGATVHTYRVDLCDREEIYVTAEKVKKEVGKIDILINNAGIVTGEKFLDSPDRLIEKTMAVNSLAHFWTLKCFLPAMLEENHGHIVTIASSAGMFGVKGLADYCASKFAAVGLHEAMEAELYALNKDGVNMTLVCPYFINTGMFDGIQTRIPIVEYEYAVATIVDAILTNTRQLMMPRLLLASCLVTKSLFPVKVSLIIGKLFGLTSTMDEFRGRKKVE